MTERDLILRDAILEALAEYPGRSLSVAALAALAAERLGVATEPGRVVRPILQSLERDGRVRNTSSNPQCTEWRLVTDAERLADAERTSLRSRARAAAATLRALGVQSASAERGAVRVSISAHDAERLAAALGDLGTCDGGEL